MLNWKFPGPCHNYIIQSFTWRHRIRIPSHSSGPFSCMTVSRFPFPRPADWMDSQVRVILSPGLTGAVVAYRVVCAEKKNFPLGCTLLNGQCLSPATLPAPFFLAAFALKTDNFVIRVTCQLILIYNEQSHLMWHSQREKNRRAAFEGGYSCRAIHLELSVRIQRRSCLRM